MKLTPELLARMRRVAPFFDCAQPRVLRLHLAMIDALGAAMAACPDEVSWSYVTSGSGLSDEFDHHDIAICNLRRHLAEVAKLAIAAFVAAVEECSP